MDALAREVLEGEYAVGMAIALVRPDGVEYFGYGRKGPDDAAPPDADTVFEVGSTTKVFTAVLLAEAVRRGLVTLDTPVADLLPPEVGAPARGDKVITLEHLATHRSGLPRMPTNFAPKDPANPYADYGADQLYAFLRKHALARDPGTGYEYSNLGAGLLGHVLSLAANKPYETLVEEWIAAPLGMESTTVALDASSQQRLAVGHDEAGEPVGNWDLAVLAGAGALRSTARDMAAFVRANLAGDGPLAQTLAMTHEPRADIPDGKVALGWHVGLPGLPGAVWHNGMTGGYHAFMAFDPDREVGVVVLTNTAQPVMDAFGTALLLMMRGDPYAFDLPAAADVSEDVLDRYVGEYPLVPGFVLTVTRKGQKLFVQATGQPRFRVYPKSATEFVYRVVDARITFQVDDDGTVTGLTLHQNGRDMPARKTK